MKTQDEVLQRELFVIKKLRMGYTRKYVVTQLVENYGLTEKTAIDVVNRIGAELNKGLASLREDAAEYIYNTLLSTIDETIDDKDRKNRIRALELLAKVCKVGNTDEKTEVHINFGFRFDDEDVDVSLDEADKVESE